MKQQQGFTLVELVIVIVVLGILAAVAVPKFVDLSGEASTASAQGIAATLSSASMTNYAKRKINPDATGVVTLNQTNVCTAARLGELLGNAAGVSLVSTAPTTTSQYRIQGTGDCRAVTGNESVTCTIKGRDATDPVDVLIQCAR